MPTVTFSVAEGQTLALMGPSGSGKTLLLRAIADLDPSTGEVALDGENRMNLPAPKWRQRVAYVAAEPGWWEQTARAHFADWSLAQPFTDRLMLPPEIGSAPIARLSTGERQRLALIRALVGNPCVLLLDEPTASLDAEATSAVETILRRRAEEGTTIVLATHDAAQAARLAGHVLRLSNGRAEIEVA